MIYKIGLFAFSFYLVDDMDNNTFQPRNRSFHTYRRRGPNASTVALTDEFAPEGAKSRKRRDSIWPRSIRHGYWKKIWRFEWILGIAVTLCTLWCLYGVREWKKLPFDDPVTALPSSLSQSAVNQSTNGYRWDGNNDDERGASYVPPDNERWPTPRKTVFRLLSQKEKRNLESMKKDYETLQSNGMLLPCRLDDGDDCFREITPSIVGYVAKLLRSSLTTGTVGRRMLLRNSLEEGMLSRKTSVRFGQFHA